MAEAAGFLFGKEELVKCPFVSLCPVQSCQREEEENSATVIIQHFVLNGGVSYLQ